MKSSKKYLFIVNPVAGAGLAKEYVPTLKKIINQRNLTAEIVLTERKKHATKIAADFVKKGFDHIFAVGGDGTFNEVVQAIIDKPGITFGTIPAGTGNDFISILGFPGQFNDKNWEMFFAENTVKMDVGKCNDLYFINGMGLGFDAQVAAENHKSENEQNSKKGKSNYLWHILKTLVSYKEIDMEVTFEGKATKSKSFLNTISNGRRIAGGLFLTPDAFANDGLLDVCLIKELRLPGRIKELIHVMKQTHTQDEDVNYFKTDKISFDFGKEVPAHLDGELYFNSKFDIRVVPAALNIIYNPQGSHYFDLSG